MNDGTAFRAELRRWLKLRAPPLRVEFTVVDIEMQPSFRRQRLRFATEDGDSIPAFLLVPNELRAPAPAVVIHHQHNGERHLGKSEVCGLVGDPLQAFGPALAQRGFIVLAADSICFEDRRTNAAGVEPHADDWLQHYNEMSCRLLRGDTLMRKVLEDAQAALSLVASLELVDPSKVGVIGHSYGGNTTLFQAALDERVRYACTSGAVCSFRNKVQHGTGIEMAEILPGALARFDVEDLLKLAAPRPMLVVSASDDPYSRDASEMVRLAGPAYEAAAAPAALKHARYQGGHALTRERFEHMVEWVASSGSAENLAAPLDPRGQRSGPRT